MEGGHHTSLRLSLMQPSPLGVNVFALVPCPKGPLHAIPAIYLAVGQETAVYGSLELHGVHLPLA